MGGTCERLRLDLKLRREQLDTLGADPKPLTPSQTGADQ